MKTTKILATILLLILAQSCRGGMKKQIPACESDTVTVCTDPVCSLLIQPYNTFDIKRAKALSSVLVQYIDSVTGINVVEATVLDPIKLDNAFMNDGRTRYRAEKILDAQLKLLTTPNTTVIGLIDSDISASVRGNSDWGVLGLAYTGRRTCVVSTYRIRNIDRDLWKVAFHEFNHSFMGNPHCPDNNTYCIMQDCNGKADFSNKRSLCNTCSKML